VSEPLFEEWLVAERERLREMALEALARLLAEQSKAAAPHHAIQTAVRLLGLDPLQETGTARSCGLYARQGRRGAALKQYQMCVTRAAAGAGDKARGGDEAGLSGTAQAPGRDGGGSGRSSGLSLSLRAEGGVGSAPRSPGGGDHHCSGGRRNWGGCESCSARPVRGHGHVAHGGGVRRASARRG
jgi:hypothetical protein